MYNKMKNKRYLYENGSGMFNAIYFLETTSNGCWFVAKKAEEQDGGEGNPCAFRRD